MNILQFKRAFHYFLKQYYILTWKYVMTYYKNLFDNKKTAHLHQHQAWADSEDLS